MFGEPIVVILYCFFMCVSPFCGKDSNQTRRFLATSKIFLQVFFQTRKELATLTRNLVDKEETIRFFFLRKAYPISVLQFVRRKTATEPLQG